MGMVRRDGNQFTIGQEQVKLLRDFVRPYARRKAEVFADDRSGRWIVRGDDRSGIPPISYSDGSFLRNFVDAGSATSGSDSEQYLQCGWDLLIRMDRAFQVVDVTGEDLGEGKPNDYVVVAQDDDDTRLLLPAGVLTASNARQFDLIGSDAGSTPPDDFTVFVSYRRPPAESTNQTAQLIAALARNMKELYREEHRVGRSRLLVWWDEHIDEGAEWIEQIRHQLVSADLVIILVDADWAHQRQANPGDFFVKEERLALANRDLWATSDGSVGPHRVVYLRVGDAAIPKDVLKRHQTTLTLPLDRGEWDNNELVRVAAQAFRAGAARLERSASLQSVLGPASHGADVSRPMSRVEPSSQRRSDAPDGPWLFVASTLGYSVRNDIDVDGARSFKADEAVAASDGSLVVMAGQCIGGLRQLRAYETDGPGGAQWRWPPITTCFQEDCRLDQGRLLTVERFGREYWLLWEVAGMTWAARFDRSGVVWGERPIYRSAVRSVIAATSLPRSERSPTFVAVSQSGLPLSGSTPYPNSWGLVFDRFEELHEIRQASAQPTGGTSRSPSISIVGTDHDGVCRIVVFDPSTGVDLWSAHSVAGRFERHQISPDASAIAAVVGERLYQWAIPERVETADR